MAFDAVDELVEPKWLREMTRRPDLVSPSLRALGRGHDDDGHFRAVLLERLRHRPAVHHRHTHVEEHERGMPGTHQRERFLAAARGHDLIALRGEDRRHRVEDGWIVIDEEYAGPGALPPLATGHRWPPV